MRKRSKTHEELSTTFSSISKNRDYIDEKSTSGSSNSTVVAKQNDLLSPIGSPKSTSSKSSLDSQLDRRESYDSVTDDVNREKRRHRHMHQHFAGQIPHDQICIADFSCALVKDRFLRQGKLYISQEFIAFHSPIMNTKKIFHVSEIKELVPKTTMMFPTALDIVLVDDEVVQLISLFFRQNTIHCIQSVMKNYINTSCLFEQNAGHDDLEQEAPPPGSKVGRNLLAITVAVLLILLNLVVFSKSLHL